MLPGFQAVTVTLFGVTIMSIMIMLMKIFVSEYRINGRLVAKLVYHRGIVMKWILLLFLLGCLIVSCSGCMNSQKIKVITDISEQGEVSYHTEYVAEF